MPTRVLAIALVAVALAACATALPPAVTVTDLRSLAGTYSGNTVETGELERWSTKLVVEPDGRFELAASDPKGFRTIGRLVLEPGGGLIFEYEEMRGRGQVAKGRATVHEGDGQRAIVLVKDDGTMTTRVSRSLP